MIYLLQSPAVVSMWYLTLLHADLKQKENALDIINHEYFEGTKTTKSEKIRAKHVSLAVQNIFDNLYIFAYIFDDFLFYKI